MTQRTKTAVGCKSSSCRNWGVSPFWGVSLFWTEKQQLGALRLAKSSQDTYFELLFFLAKKPNCVSKGQAGREDGPGVLRALCLGNSPTKPGRRSSQLRHRLHPLEDIGVGTQTQLRTGASTTGKIPAGILSCVLNRAYFSLF